MLLEKKEEKVIINNKITTNFLFYFTDSKLKRVGIVSTKEIARDRGKPLSKYERNIMIFDWLHTLDETATASHEHEHEHVADSQEQITVKKEGQK